MSVSAPRRDRETATVRAPGSFVGIEGLRACAALSVMVAHATALAGLYVIPHSVNNLIFLALHGVTLFFVLSGFLLYAPFARAVIDGRPVGSIRTFYRHRVFRIAPAYVFIFLLASLVFGAVVTKAAAYGEAPGSTVGRITDLKTFVLNLFLLQGYVPSGVLTGLSVSWSLLPEVVFYLVLPGLALLGQRLSSRIKPELAMLVPGIGLTVLGTAGRLWSQHLTNGSGGVVGYTYRNTGATWSAVLSHSFLSQCDLFGYGMIAGTLIVIAGKEATRPRWLTITGATALTFGLLTVAVTRNQERSDPFIGLFCAGLMILVVTAPTRGSWHRIGRILDSAIPRRLGVISYSIYLWHFAVVIFVTQHVREARTLPEALALIALACVASIVLAEITYRIVEAPAMRRARRVAPGRHTA